MYLESELDQIMEECSQEIQGAQIYDELRRVLSVLNGRNIRSVLEIGSEDGGTLKVWARMFNPCDFVTLDLNSYPHASGKQVQLEQRWRSWLQFPSQLSCVWGDSHDPNTLAAVSKALRENPSIGGKVDLLYIDGDHSELGVEQDYNMYKGLVNSPGVILFHDIHPYRGREETKGNLLGVSVYKFWERFKGPALDQFKDRTYHKGLRPNFVEICHDCSRQQSFGFGMVFV